ncbi:replication initiator protein A, partial [Neglectibacter sp. X58]|uniref:replication initiator protein A n=1 Tax=unclassified Neglectibacter TaxID=2632164 RepID=UPI00325C289D
MPKILLTDRRYKGVSLEAKVLYGLLLDRMGLSARNGWLDDNGRVFLCFTQEEVMTMLDCGKDKATKLFRELE